MSYETAVARMFALGHELAQTPSQTPSQKFDLAHMRVLLEPRWIIPSGVSRAC